MPIINPPDAKTCSAFINQHKEEIIKGVYDIQTSPQWIDMLTSEELLLLFKYCPSSKIVLAGSKKVPPNGLASLAKDNDVSVLQQVAMNPNVPDDCLIALSKSPDDGVRKMVARNPKTPPNILEILSYDSNSKVREEVAENPNTPERIMEALAKDPDFGIAYSLLHNPKASGKVLEALIKYHTDLRQSIWRERQDMETPEYIIEMLAKDTDWQVRKIVAAVPKTPERILDMLAKDSNETVRDRAKKNPNYKGIMSRIRKILS